MSVIIPAYNEARTIAEIVRRIRAGGLVAEIVVVDDGSTDRTAAILDELQRADGTPLRLVRQGSNRGKGAAVRSGLLAARGDVALIQDADLEYDPADYAVLLAPFTDPEVHAVYGSRNLQENPRSSDTFYWGGRALSWVANALFGSRLTDIATGYKAIRLPLALDLELACDGFEFCEEITARLLQRGIVIHEAPISYQPRTRAEGKKIRARDGLTAVWTLLRLRVSGARRDPPNASRR